MRTLRFLLIVCMLLWSAPLLALQTIVYDSTSGQTGTGTTSATFNATIAATSNIALACVGIRESGGVPVSASSVTIGGEAMALLDSNGTGGGNTNRTDLWYKLAPPTGTSEVVVTGGTGTDFLTVGVVAYSGVAQTDTFNTVKKDSTSTNNADANSIVSAVGEMGVACFSGRISQPFSVAPDSTSPQSTERIDVDHANDAGPSLWVYEEAGAGSTVDIRTDITGTVTYWTYVAVSMRQAPDAVSSPTRRRAF